MHCRSGCGACCVAPSISSPLPGMPHGKPAGVPCIHLTVDYRCGLFGQPERPAVCVQFQATASLCGTSRREAFDRLQQLEAATA
ncbi:YkgJ family cysteine cluster protein [Aquisalimonas sp.]|uniref:YkgJ family cysteine cluster protein n=1 Tax=Aquisalimonas sp. TaxID=1872621 RepID=UPI0025BE5A0D|nr:YkgJ family cysteine cluster protein [Aquisalimonas sp.]